MTLRYPKQRARWPCGFASSLLPILECTHRNTKQGGKCRLTEASMLTYLLNIVRNLNFVTPAFTTFDCANTFQKFLSDITLFSHDSISFLRAFRT